ncbi:MAG: IPTL-CTERM sorting domain-containing protein [Ottowia sp.]|nr:IPTL-CTERM sorting domain-containing protein [Ottowia sp.]
MTIPRNFLLAALLLFAGVASAQTYVGSFQVDDGDSWQDNPPVYSAQEAAALLFGGQPADYAISINPSPTDPATITHTAYYSTWGEGCGVFAETERVDEAPPGYRDPGGDGTARSAYVSDWCLNDETNHVWLLTPMAAPVPVPTLGQWGLLLLGLAAAGLGMGRLRRG